MSKRDTSGVDLVAVQYAPVAVCLLDSLRNVHDWYPEDAHDAVGAFMAAMIDGDTPIDDTEEPA